MFLMYDLIVSTYFRVLRQESEQESGGRWIVSITFKTTLKLCSNGQKFNHLTWVWWPTGSPWARADHSWSRGWWTKTNTGSHIHHSRLQNSTSFQWVKNCLNLLHKPPSFPPPRFLAIKSKVNNLHCLTSFSTNASFNPFNSQLLCIEKSFPI